MLTIDRLDYVLYISVFWWILHLKIVGDFIVECFKCCQGF